jgi:hypothetical protein
MAGYLDFHVLVVLQNAWKAVSATEAAFVALFQRDIDAGQITLEQVEAFYAALVPDGDQKNLIFVQSWSSSHAEKLQVAVELSDTADDQHYLGGQGANEHEFAVAVDESVKLRCYAPHPGTTRAVDAAVLQMMLAYSDVFLSVHHEAMLYGGSGPLSPLEEMLPEGQFVRLQNWKSKGLVRADAATPAGDPKTWFIAAADMLVGGHPGGVTAELEE